MATTLTRFARLEMMDEHGVRNEIKCHFQSNFDRLMSQRTDKLIASNTSIPIAFVSNELTASIDAKCRIIRLSKDTLNKFFNKHLDMIQSGILCHETVQHLIDNGLVIKEGRNNYTRVILFLGKLKGINQTTKLYKLAIKTTRNGGEIYLTTLHQIQPSLMQNICDNGILIRQQKLDRKYQFESYQFTLLAITFVILYIFYITMINND